MLLKRLICGKKGMETREIVTIIIVLVVLVISFFAVIMLRVKGGSLLDMVRNVLRGGRP